MFIKLLLIFIFVPLIELALLIKVGDYVGLFATIMLVASTGAIGISLARKQGLAVIGEIKSNLSQAKLPHDSLIDGLLILIGAAMLLTPGLLTDIAGFSLIIPVTRKRIRRIVNGKMKERIVNNSTNDSQGFDDKEVIIDIEDYEEVDEE